MGLAQFYETKGHKDLSSRVKLTSRRIDFQQSVNSDHLVHYDQGRDYTNLNSLL